MSQGANNDANNYGLSALPYFLQDAGGLVNTRQNDAQIYGYAPNYSTGAGAGAGAATAATGKPGK